MSYYVIAAQSGLVIEHEIDRDGVEVVNVGFGQSIGNGAAGWAYFGDGPVASIYSAVRASAVEPSLPPPSPTLLALLRGFHEHRAAYAVVDLLCEEYPQLIPYCDGVLADAATEAAA